MRTKIVNIQRGFYIRSHGSAVSSYMVVYRHISGTYFLEHTHATSKERRRHKTDCSGINATSPRKQNYQQKSDVHDGREISTEPAGIRNERRCRSTCPRSEEFSGKANGSSTSETGFQKRIQLCAERLPTANSKGPATSLRNFHMERIPPSFQPALRRPSDLLRNRCTAVRPQRTATILPVCGPYR